MTKEDKDRIADFFESWELAEYLRTPIESFIEAFEDDIEDVLEDINELMDYGDRDAEV